MFTVRKENGPAVGLIVTGTADLRGPRHPRAIRIDAPDRTFGVRRIDDYILASPTAAPPSNSGSQHLRRTTCDRRLLEFAIGEKRDVGTIRRPKGITCPLSGGQKRDSRGTHALHKKHGKPKFLFLRHKNHHCPLPPKSAVTTSQLLLK